MKVKMVDEDLDSFTIRLLLNPLIAFSAIRESTLSGKWDIYEKNRRAVISAYCGTDENHYPVTFNVLSNNDSIIPKYTRKPILSRSEYEDIKKYCDDEGLIFADSYFEKNKWLRIDAVLGTKEWKKFGLLDSTVIFSEHVGVKNTHFGGIIFTC
jgi:hypothetical protein